MQGRQWAKTIHKLASFASDRYHESLVDREIMRIQDSETPDGLEDATGCSKDAQDLLSAASTASALIVGGYLFADCADYGNIVRTDTGSLASALWHRVKTGSADFARENSVLDLILGSHTSPISALLQGMEACHVAGGVPDGHCQRPFIRLQYLIAPSHNRDCATIKSRR